MTMNLAIRRIAEALAISVPLLLAASPAEAADVPADDPRPYDADAEIEAVGKEVGRQWALPLRRMEAIIQRIFWKRDGLDFRYRSHPTLTASEAFAQRQGNCLSLVNLFVAMARSAGLEAFFLEVEDFESFYRYESTVVRSTHVIGGVWIDGKLRTVDFLPDRDKSYRRMTVVSDDRATAQYYNSTGAEAMLDGQLDSGERLFRRALELDPEFPDIWNNLGVLLRRQGRLDEGIAALEKALALDPRFLPAMENLSGYYRLAGRPEKAARMEARALEEKTRNPYYLFQQALLQFQKDKLDQAERMLKRARRIDNKIPEVYLLLGRVELARGDQKRAESLFAKARKMSASYPEDFQNGLNSKIRQLMASAN